MKKKLLLILILLLFFLALLQLDIHQLLDSMGQIPLWSIVLLMVIQIGSQLLVVVQWHQMGKLANASLSFWDMFYINCQGAVVDGITPGAKVGGEITRSMQISRISCCSNEQAIAIVVLQKLFSLSAFFLISLFAISYLMRKIPSLHATFLQLFVYGVFILFLILFFGIQLKPQRVKNFVQLKWKLKGKSFLLAFLDYAISLHQDSKTWMRFFLLSLLIWFIYPFKMYLLATQFYADVHLILVGAIAFAAYMIAMLPIFPGGLGGFEGTMISLLVAIGFIQSDAIIVTVLFRFITFWFVMLFSLAFIAFYKMMRKGASQ